MTWVTEITQVENGKYFVDEQRVGPYKIWISRKLEEIFSYREKVLYKRFP